VLQVFKTQPPRGVKNVIPLAGASDGWHTDPTTFLMNAFVYDDGDNASAGNPVGADHFVIQNGKVSFAPVQPQWKEGLAYLHSLFQQGLVNSNTFFTQNADQLTSEVQQGRVGVFADGASNSLINYGAPGSDYQYWWVVPPLKGPHGVRYAAFYGNGPTSTQFAITNKATPDQIRAIMKLADFVFTEKGVTLFDFGPSGVFWTPAKKGQSGLDKRQAVIDIQWNKLSGGALQNWGWNQMGLMYQSAHWFNSQAASPEFAPNGSQSLLYDMTKQFYAGHQPKEVYPAVGATWIPPAQAQQYEMMRTNINNYVSQWNDQSIVGSKDITKDWNTYVQGVKNLGLQQYLQIAQSAMGKPFDTTSPLFRGGAP
jgi:putative aldouronate transport system substrate-binding protein